MYEVNGWMKYGERDYYENGCDPNEYVSFSGTERWNAETVPELLSMLRDFVCVDEDYEIELDACDEDGRVDISVMETNESYTATEWQIEEWKNGNISLWYSTYTFYVEKVSRVKTKLLKD